MIRLIRYLFLLAIILVTSLYIVLLFIDLNHFKGPIEREISSLLDREVEVGRIELKMSLVPKLAIKDLVVKNPEGFDSKDYFATVGSTDLTVSIIPLFHGIFQLDAIHLSGAKISLIETDGKNNWEFSQKKESAAGKKVQITPAPKYQSKHLDVNRFKVDQISISDSVVTLTTKEKTETVLLSSFALNELKNATMQLSYNGVPIQMNFSTSNVLRVLDSGYLDDFTLNVRAYDALIKISGKLDDVYSLKNMNFTFDISASDFGKTLASFGEKELSELAMGKPLSVVFTLQGSLNDFKLSGLAAEVKNMANIQLNSVVQNISTSPKISVKGNAEVKSYEITSKYGIQPVTIDFDSLYDEKNVAINKLSVFINRSDIFAKGNIDLSQPVAFLKGQVYSNYFDLADVISEKETELMKTDVQKDSSVSKDEKISLPFLKEINGDLEVSFSNLKVLKTDKDYHKGSFSVYLKDGVLSLDPCQFNFLNGSVVGSARLDTASSPMGLSLNLKGNDLMISDLKDVSPHLRNARANIFVNIHSSGNTTKSLLGALNGEMKVQVSSGLIVNKWFNSLPGLIGIVTKNSAFSYADTEAQSELNCAAMKLVIKDGIVKSDKNIAIETAMINLVISGDIDFRNETLSLSLIPSLNHLNNKVNKKLSIAQFIRLEGSFSDIKMREDTKGALEALKDKEIEKLAQKIAGVKSEKSETYIPIGGLCQLALGEDLDSNNAQKDNVSDVKQEQNNKQAPTAKDLKESLKEQVKDQITKSLTEIFKRK